MDARVIQQKSFASRFAVPASTVLFICALMYVLHHYLWMIAPPEVHRPVALVAGIGSFLSRLIPPLFIYPWAYFKGATPGERVLASLLPLFAWYILEVVAVAQVYSIGEALYYLLGSLLMLQLFANLSMIALCEFVCRIIVNRRGAKEKVFSPVLLAGIASGPAATWLLLIWGGGVHWFYIYQTGYKALFH